MCAGAGCVCQREGALWVRQCCMLSEGMAGRETGTALHPPFLLVAPLRGLGMPEGNSRLAHLAGLYRVSILGGEPFDFLQGSCLLYRQS